MFSFLLLGVKLRSFISAIATLPINLESGTTSSSNGNAIAIFAELKVRIHAALIFDRPWTKLWYLCRGLDQFGRGYVRLDIDELCQFLDCGRSTVYEWLRDGRIAGAFRTYSRRGNLLKIWLGGLVKLCKFLDIRDWGAVAEIPLGDLHQIKPIATAAQTQRMQQQSHHVARRSLSPKERQFYKVPTAEQILKQVGQSSAKPAQGQVPCLLWVGRSKAFVSKGFLCHGVSQETIAGAIRRSPRTVRRHLQALEVMRRQIVQGKFEYTLIMYGTGLNNGGKINETHRYQLLGDDWLFHDDKIRLFEPNGHTSSRKKDGLVVPRSRFFHYLGKTWLYKCNLYSLNYSLKSMHCRRQSLKFAMGEKSPKKAIEDKQNLSAARLGDVDGVSIFGAEQGKEGQKA